MRQPKPAFSVEYRNNRKPSPKVFDLTEKEPEPDFEFNQDPDFSPPIMSADDEYEKALRAADAAFEKREIVPALQRKDQQTQKPVEASPATPPKIAKPFLPEPPVAPPVPVKPSHAAAEKLFAKQPEAEARPEERRILQDLTQKPIEERQVRRRGRPPKSAAPSAPESRAAELPLEEVRQPEAFEWGGNDVYHDEPAIAPEISASEIAAHMPKVRRPPMPHLNQQAISAGRRALWARIRPPHERHRTI